MKKYILIVLILFVISLTGCASTKPKSNPEEILNNAINGSNNKPTVITQSMDLKTNDLPYAPILLPPQVEKVWIYPHVTPTGELVTGHWIFIKINDGKWYLEDYNSLSDIGTSNVKIPTGLVTESNPNIGGSSK
jgi:hypothetical protein